MSSQLGMVITLQVTIKHHDTEYEYKRFNQRPIHVFSYQKGSLGINKLLGLDIVSAGNFLGSIKILDIDSRYV
jgi:hypothetical protein